ncbi:x-box binding protein [Anaeramoeba flamelloides]|uniref:X-box binding protein n=1 Tax=Anaeramoeba flamelloides TaxID=1746091 RepID=A0AAV8A700_9EUKA|nr:x-box binding protein [Anaeramoeba flamelloides]
MTDLFDLNNSLDFDFDLNQTDLSLENSFFENELLSTIDDDSLNTDLLLSLQEDSNVSDQKSPIDTQQPFSGVVDEYNFSTETKETMSIEIDNLGQKCNEIKNETVLETKTVEMNNNQNNTQNKTSTIHDSKPKTKSAKNENKNKNPNQNKKNTKNQKPKTKKTNRGKKTDLKKEIIIKKNPKNKGIIIQIKKCRKRTLSDRKSLNGNGKFSVNPQPIWVENKMGDKVNLLTVMNKYEFNLLTEEQKKKRKLLKNRISAEESRLRARQKLGGLQTKVETLVNKNTKLNKIITKIQDEKEQMRKEIELLRIRLLNQSKQKHKHSSYKPITKVKRTNTHPIMRSLQTASTATTNRQTQKNPNTNTNANTNATTSKLFSSVRDNAYELFSDLTSINYKSSKPNQKLSFLKHEKEEENVKRIIDEDNTNYNEYQFGGMNSQQTGFSLFIILLIFGLFFQTNLLGNSISNQKILNQNLLNNLPVASTGARTVLTTSEIQSGANHDFESENLFFQKDFDHLHPNTHYRPIRDNYNLKNHTNYEMCVEYNPKYLSKNTIWLK